MLNLFASPIASRPFEYRQRMRLCIEDPSIQRDEVVFVKHQVEVFQSGRNKEHSQLSAHEPLSEG